MNKKIIWIIGSFGSVVLLAGWANLRVDIDAMRASYAISPDAVIMFSTSDCGAACVNQEAKMRAMGLEVVALDIQDETAGTHLWKALDGRNGSLPAFLMGGSNHLQDGNHFGN